jgi:nucleoprotein TPR
MANPFAATPVATTGATAPNPFASNNQAAPPQNLPLLSQLPQPQTQLPQPVRTGIPVSANRGGAAQRGRGGAYVPPGSRAVSGQGERGGGNLRGRGGHGRGGMNPGATDFQPGNKRPRGDSEVGGGAKRARGGGGAH